MSTLALSFHDNGRLHDDLVLQLGGRSWRCDSYYLALDSQFDSSPEDASKVRRVLRRLLEQWRAAIQELLPGSRVFLPYDFSDQYTGWLECDRANDDVQVSHGYSPVEGWSFFPSDIVDHLVEPREFRREEPGITMSVDALLASIDQALQDAA